VTLATFLLALMAAPSWLTPAVAAGGGDPPSSSGPPPSYPPPSNAKASKAKKKANKQSSVDEPAFIQGYRAAYATIYDRNDYAAAIEQLKAPR
jgi:hypothetical protein